MRLVVRSLGDCCKVQTPRKNSTVFCTVKVLFPRMTSWNIAAPTETIALEGVTSFHEVPVDEDFPPIHSFGKVQGCACVVL
jgi:hypothetical protein